MKIGTPLSNSATKVMILGSGELGKEVVIALQRLGVEVTAVDRYDNAPAMQVAHKHFTINMADCNQLRQLVERERPQIIIPEIEAIATEELLKIEKEKLAEVIPTARAVNLTMNREGIRRLAAEELHLPTSPYVFAETLDELKCATKKIGFPCFVKPVMSSSGKGQTLLNSEDDILPAWEYAAKGGRVNKGKVIVEGKINFDYEITQLTVRAIGNSGDVETFFCEPIGHVQKKGDYVESWQPMNMTQKALEKARDIAKTITSALGGRGIFGVELLVKGDDVFFSELSPRPHDTGLVTLATQRFSEFELHARAVMGLPVDTTLREKGASAVIYGGINEKGVTFTGVDDALKIDRTDIRIFGKPEAFERRRMGVCLAVAENTDKARENAKMAASCVKVIKE